MTKKTSFSISKTGQTLVLASVLLVAFAIFLSQASPLFLNAAAAPSNIRGSIVLTDRTIADNPIQIQQSIQVSPISLPGSSCTVQFSACGSNLGSINTYSNSNVSLSFDNQDLTKISPKFTKTSTNRFDNAQCSITDPFTTTGGIHVLRAEALILNAYGVAHAGQINSLTVAYDCVP